MVVRPVQPCREMDVGNVFGPGTIQIMNIRRGAKVPKDIRCKNGGSHIFHAITCELQTETKSNVDFCDANNYQ